MENNVFAQVDHYITELLNPEDDILLKTLSSIDRAGLPQASISASQGKLLQVLARACQARKILELGTLGGYSTIWLGRCLPPNGKLITVEYDPRHAELAHENIDAAGLHDIVDIRVGKALDVLPLLEKENAGPFDLIFIDADKPPYTEYFQWALRLSRPGTLIIADNVVRAGKVLDANSSDPAVVGVRRLTDFLATCQVVTTTIIQTVGVKEHDGMVIATVNP
jgi:caffeoyl-CoA O-methyltransferase